MVDEAGSNPLAQLRALDPGDPLTPGRVATILVQLDRHELSAAEAEAIYAEVRRIRRALLKLPTLIVRPPYIGSRRSGRA
jgi:hypothetical protein